LEQVGEEERRRRSLSPAESLVSYCSEVFKRQPPQNKPVTSPQFSIDVTIYDAAKEPHRTRISLDTGAETNLVNNLYANIMEFQRVEIPPPAKPRAVQDLPIRLGPAYQVRWAARDSWGQKRRMETIFYGIDDSSISLLLGMPGMEAGGIATSTPTREWRWGIQVDELKVFSPRKFAELLEGEGTVYALVCTGQEPAGLRHTCRARQVQTETPLTLPEELEEYRDVFKPPEHPMPVAGAEHTIETSADPPHGPIYNLSQKELEALRQYLETALEKGWIRHSTSPAGAPILFVPKKDGGLRLCVDYRALNRVTVKNRLALPLISEILDRLNGKKWLTKLDLKDAYYRIPVAAQDQWKTAFRTRYGHFEYLVMPFGLTNAPATFQAYINKALGSMVDVTCVVYLDDILIFSETREDHVEHVKEALERLRRYGLYANPVKCKLFQENVDFLGFIVGVDGIQMDPERIKTIAEWPTPRSFHDVQVFLGFVNFYRRFIQGYSQIARPLTDLLKGTKDGKKFHAEWKWSETAEKAFSHLRAAFQSAPILAHFDPTRRIRVETDASKYAIAAILSQLQEGDGHWHPVAFWSRKLIPAETRYETHDQELLAIVQAFRHWRHYLEGSANVIEVLTDHNNLVAFSKLKQLNGRQARWAISLSEFDFTIQHRPGKANPADAPSRRPDYVPDAQEVEDNLNEMLPTLRHKLELLDLGDAGKEPYIHWVKTQKSILEQPKDRPEQDQNTAQGELYPEYTSPSEESSDFEYIENSDGDSDWELLSDQGENTARDSSDIADLPSQTVPRGVARICAAHVHPVYGEDEDNPLDQHMKELIRKLQDKDEFVIQKRAVTQKRSTRSKTAQTADRAWQFEDDLLYFNDRLYVPNEVAVRQELMSRFHDSRLAGHFGGDRTLELLQRHYHWQDMEREVDVFVKTCPECQWSKARRHKPYGMLRPLPVPEAPWEDITLDFITDLPKSTLGNETYDATLVIVDKFTKMAIYCPTRKTAKASDLSDIFIASVIRCFGVPKSITSDRGSVFLSHLWRDFCTAVQMSRRLSTSFHPQTDGQTERQNQLLETYLRTFCNEQQDDWVKLLPMAEFAYNNSVHSVTGTTPFRALYGKDPRVSWNDPAVTDALRKRKGKLDPGSQERLDRLNQAHGKIMGRLLKAQETQKKWYDAKRQGIAFVPGQQVLMSTKNLKLARPKKNLCPKYLGPLTVLDNPSGHNGPNHYMLDLPANWAIHNVVNVSRLEPYYKRDSERPASDIAMPAAVELDDEERWVIEEVIDRRWDSETSSLEYKVRWEGEWPPDQKETWEPSEHLTSESITEFNAKRPLSPQPERNNLQQKGATKKRRQR
jgi:transposase InsO family protein